MKEDDLVRFVDGTTERRILKIDEGYADCVWLNKLNEEMKGSIPLHLLEKIT